MFLTSMFADVLCQDVGRILGPGDVFKVEILGAQPLLSPQISHRQVPGSLGTGDDKSR